MREEFDEPTAVSIALQKLICSDVDPELKS